MIAWQSNLVSLLHRFISVFTSGVKTLSAHWPHMACECFDWLVQKLKYKFGSLWMVYVLYSLLRPPPSFLPPHSFILPVCPLKVLWFGTPDLDKFHKSSLPLILFSENFYMPISS